MRGLLSDLDLAPVSAREIDAYLRGLKEPKRRTLQELRRTILEILPDAEQVISYRVPAFRVGGKTVAGFAAFKDHLSYLPFSGSVLGQLGLCIFRSIDPAEDARPEADSHAPR